MNTVLNIVNIIAEKEPEALEFDEDLINQFVQLKAPAPESEITLELVSKIVQWDKKNKRLKPFEYNFMKELVDGVKTLTEHNKKLVKYNLVKVKKFGFNEDV
jgi:hypothetical protein